MRGLSIAIGVVGLSATILTTGQVVHPAVAARPWTTLACLLVAITLVAARPLAPVRGRACRAFFDSPAHLFTPLLALVGTASFASLSHRFFEATPRLDDSVAALFSARLFLTGHLTTPLPEYPEFFEVFGVLSSAQGVEHLVGMYPPGWSVLLMPGVATGLAWLVNPLLGGTLAVTVVAFGTELFDRSVGRIAGLLVVMSPLLGVLSATHLSHTATVLLCCLSWWAVLRLMRTGESRYGWIAGSALGLALLTRPMSALVLGIVMALLPLSKPRETIARWRGCAAAVALVLVGGGLLLAYQATATGDPLTTGHRQRLGEGASLGWVKAPGADRHTPAKARQMTTDRLEVVNFDLLGWPVGAALVIAVPFLLGDARWREFWLLIPFFALLGLFAFFYYYPVYLPGRYLATSLPALLVLVAAGWRFASDRLAAGQFRRLPDTLLVFCLLFSLACGLPAYHQNYGRLHGDVETLLPQKMVQHEVTNAVVLYRVIGSWARGFDPENDYYASAFRLNDLDFAGDVIYARDLGPGNIRLMRAYPERSFYLYIFDRTKQQARLFKGKRRADGSVGFKLYRKKGRPQPPTG